MDRLPLRGPTRRFAPLSNEWAWFLIVPVGILAGCCLQCLSTVKGFWARVDKM